MGSGDLNELYKAGVDLEKVAAQARAVEVNRPPEDEEAEPELPPMPEAPPPEAYDDDVEVHDPDGLELPEVQYTLRRHYATERALRLLGEQPSIYEFGDELVHLTPDPKSPRTVRPVPFTVNVLLDHMTSCMRFTRYDKDTKGWVPRQPPREVAQTILEKKDWRQLRHLVGLTQAPVFLGDGTILQTPGYDEASGLLYQPTRTYPRIPERPTARQVDQAVQDLLGLVVDFPFKAAADKSAWLALILTLVARYTIQGPAPFFLCNANKAGCGKTRLLSAACGIATGEWPIPNRAPEDDTEMEKRLTSTIRTGARVELYDNIAGVLGFPSLDQVLTHLRYKGRILGTSQNIETDVYTVFCGSVNNAILGADTHRRVLPIRMETTLEHPEDRNDFKVRVSQGLVVRRHPQLLVAALTILRAYEVAGRPDQDLPPWGSYEEWSEAVRAPIVWAGLADPLETRQGVQERDPALMARARLLKALRDRFGATPFQARQVQKAAKQNDAIQESLEELLDDINPSTKRIGRELTRMVDDWMAGHVLRRRLDSGRNVMEYVVERAMQPQTGTTNRESA